MDHWIMDHWWGGSLVGKKDNGSLVGKKIMDHWWEKR